MVDGRQHAGEGAKRIFVISPIDKKDDDGIDFTRIFLEQIVRPAAEMAGGFSSPVRADEVRAPGSITAKVVADIVDADVCIADLTGRNPNVMYEVAIAHAAGKQVILLQQEAGGPPFDFTSERTIHYSIRVDEANRARDELAEHLRHAAHDELDPKLKRTLNPVRTIFQDLMTRAEAEPTERAMLDSLAELRAEVRGLRSAAERPAETQTYTRHPPHPAELADRLADIEMTIRNGAPPRLVRRQARPLDEFALPEELSTAVRRLSLAIAHWEDAADTELGHDEHPRGATLRELDRARTLLERHLSPQSLSVSERHPRNAGEKVERSVGPKGSPTRPA
jgi:nucleoside 2-deoxyribosyltransferase